MTSYQPEPAAIAAPRTLGRYELIGHLATGGMAEIHLARLAGEAGFEKILVVKRLLPELVVSREFVAMFLDEGRLAARLDHPNVCEVYELGRDGAEYFLVMPFLDGVPVSELIARPRGDAHEAARLAAAIVGQACAGLHHAHELRGPDGAPLGLVHRDVSPSNLFATASGVVKVLDFGIAKVRGTQATEAGTVKGKTPYMAPEQLLGEDLDRRCDVFALGIVLYELATRRRLFQRASDFLIAKAILEEEVPRADVPAALADVIARALARRREDRYATAAELARALEGAVAGLGGAASTTELATTIAPSDALATRRLQRSQLVDAATRVHSEVATRPRRAPRRRGVAVAAIAGGVVALGGTWMVVTLARAPVDPTPAPAPLTSIDAARAAVALAPDAPAPTPPPDAPPPPPARPALPPGELRIDSTPYATIYVDGHEVGITPLPHVRASAGRHRVRAVRADRREQTIVVDVPAGRAAPPLVLRW